MDQKQQEIIHLMEREGRVTPQLIRDETSIATPQNTDYHLKELRRKGVVNRVAHGLYELARTPVDPSEFEFSRNAGDSR